MQLKSPSWLNTQLSISSAWVWLGRPVMRALELVSVRVQSVRGEYQERVNQYTTTARHGDIPWGKPWLAVYVHNSAMDFLLFMRLKAHPKLFWSDWCQSINIIQRISHIICVKLRLSLKIIFSKLNVWLLKSSFVRSKSVCEICAVWRVWDGVCGGEPVLVRCLVGGWLV